MEPEILALDAMYIIGTEVRTQSQLEARRSTARIPAHWEKFTNQNLARRIPDRAGEDLFSIYTHYVREQQGEYSHIIGLEVISLHNIPDGMVGLMIPESDYMVFTVQGEMPAATAQAWEGIRRFFEGNPAYHRAYTYDFEVHDPSIPDIINIYVAIRE
jgi:predicted transcriptional regulator YdeE